jgi:ferrous iron transport protein A
MPLDSAPGLPALKEQLVPLTQIDVGQTVFIAEVRTGLTDLEGGDIGLRLLELGFVEGEPVRVIAHGYPGREPLAVRIGNTTFALRGFEADHILVVRPVPVPSGAKP